MCRKREKDESYLPNYKESTFQDNKTVILNYANKINYLNNAPYFREKWVQTHIQSIMKEHNCDKYTAAEIGKRIIKAKFLEVNGRYGSN